MKENKRKIIEMNNIIKIGNVLWTTAIIWLPVLLWIAKKKIPIVDRYLQSGIIIVENIDDAIEMALLEFPNNAMLKTADDICDRVLEILKKAGYTVNKYDEPKIKTRVKGQLNRKDGLSVDWNTGEIRVNYKKEF